MEEYRKRRKERKTAKAKQIFVEELKLKPIGDSQDVPTAYCVVVDGRRSPLYFSRRQAEEAVADALMQEDSSN